MSDRHQAMEEKARQLAYCGFYCGDCLGYTGVIAEAAEGLLAVLERCRFDRTAECAFPQELGDYGRFSEILTFMAGLRCPGNCRGGEQDATGCQVRACCRDNGFFACHECLRFETCAKLRSLHLGLHAEASLHNLRAIREMGLEAWLVEGTRHCCWDTSAPRVTPAMNPYSRVPGHNSKNAFALTTRILLPNQTRT